MEFVRLRSEQLHNKTNDISAGLWPSIALSPWEPCAQFHPRPHGGCSPLLFPRSGAQSGWGMCPRSGAWGGQRGGLRLWCRLGGPGTASPLQRSRCGQAEGPASEPWKQWSRGAYGSIPHRASAVSPDAQCQQLRGAHDQGTNAGAARRVLTQRPTTCQ